MAQLIYYIIRKFGIPKSIDPESNSGLGSE